MSHDPRISHGRGGAGNIETDDHTYADGEIVREGPVGDQGDGAYSAGRGGAGNIPSPSTSTPQSRKGSAVSSGDVDIVPETATRPVPGPGYDSFHTGRGGGGNVHHDGEGHGKGEGGEEGKEGHGHGKKQVKGEGEGQGEGEGEAKGHEGLMEKARHLFGAGGGGK